MDTIVGKLGLNYIEATLDKSPQIDLAPKALTAWLRDLPLADVSATSKEIFYALHESHYVKMEPQKRFQIIELFRPIVTHITESLKPLYIGQNAANPNKKNKIAKLSETLQNELCLGYKTIIEHYGSNLDTAPEIFFQSLYQFIRQSNEIMLVNYQMYHLAPTLLWKEMNIVYAICEKNNYLSKPIIIPDANNESKVTDTVNSVYLKAILFSISNPYRLRQSDITYLHDTLIRWTSKVSMLSSLPKNAPTSNQVFMIDLNKDAAPTLNKDIDNAQNANIRHICLDKLVDYLSSLVGKLKAKPQQNTDDMLSIDLRAPKTLVESLITSWSTIPDRTDTRTAILGSLLITLGISSTHYFISESQEAAEGLESNNALKNGQVAGSSVFESKEADNGDPWRAAGKDAATEIAQQLNKDTYLNLNNSRTSQHSIYKTHNCDIIDKSENGYCLKWKDGATPQLQAGEIIGALVGKDEFGGDVWIVGSISWLKKVDSDVIHLGINIFAPSVQAVGTQLIKDNDPVGEHLRSLLLPEIPEEKISATLVTPTLPFKEGSQVEILGIHDEMVCTLGKQISHSGSYSRFALKFNEELSKQNDMRKKASEMFDSLWTHLEN